MIVKDKDKQIEIPKNIRILISFPNYTNEEIDKLIKNLKSMEYNKNVWYFTNEKISVIVRTPELIVLEVKR